MLVDDWVCMVYLSASARPGAGSSLLLGSPLISEQASLDATSEGKVYGYQ